MNTDALFPEVAAYVTARMAELDAIPEARRVPLESLAEYVNDTQREGNPAHFLFICTHNSRRSHFAQVWAAIAAQVFGRHSMHCESAGTEVSAVHPNALSALERAGLRVHVMEDGPNPLVHIVYSQTLPAIQCRSKRIPSPGDRPLEFCAVMTCTSADKACPTVPGASRRVAIPYTDPKESDGTSAEAVTYDARCAEIAREMLFAFSDAPVDTSR